MASRKQQAIPSNRLNAGIDRYESGADGYACADALDVFESQGDLCRRPAFHSVTHGPLRILPAGLTLMAYFDVNDVVDTVFHDRVKAWTAALLDPAAGFIVVGCEEPFYAIDWRYVAVSSETHSGHKFLQTQYWNGSAWVDMASVDGTWELRAVGGVYYRVPLVRNGAIAWHASTVSGWSTRTVGGRAMYCVRLKFVASDSGSQVDAESEMTLTVSSPGPRAAILDPITGIHPFRNRAAQDMVAIFADNPAPNGELGARGVVLQKRSRAPRPLQLVLDEGAGHVGTFTNPAVSRAAPGQAWPAGSWTTVTAGGGTSGSADTMVKARRDYDWVDQQFAGAIKIASLPPTSGVAQTAYDGQFNFTPSAAMGSLRDNEWRGYRLRCITNGSAAGTPVGEEREIIENDSNTVRYAEPFSVDPDSQNDFQVMLPHARLRLYGSEIDYEISDTNVAVADGIQVTSGVDYEPDNFAAADDDSPCHWAAVQDLHRAINAGRYWDGVFDPITRKLILTNSNGLLEYDGDRLRRFVVISDPDNVRAQDWAGAASDSNLDGLSAAVLVGSKLRGALPPARMVAYYQGRIVLVVADDRIIYSAPTDTDVWLFGWEARLYNSKNSPITAIWTQAGYLYASTSTSVHRIGPPDDAGAMPQRLVTEGVGFLSHRAVAPVSDSRVVGVTADGVYVFDGVSMTALVSDWDRYIEGGVNKSALHKALVATNLSDDWIFVALPASGADYNNRLMLIGKDGKVWVWSAPWSGITAMAREVTVDGIERVLFGFADGHVADLVWANTDDGDTVTGYARSVPMGSKDNVTIAPTDVMVYARDTGATETLTVRTYLDEGAQRDNSSHPVVPTDGAEPADVCGTGTYGAAVLGAKMAAKRFRLAEGARCDQIQVEVRGTGLWSVRKIQVLVADEAVRRSR